LVHLRMNDNGELHLQLVRELVNELQDIFLLLTVVKLDGPCQPVKQLHLDVVVQLNFVESRNLLLDDRLFGVMARDYRGEGSGRKGERDHSNEHEEDAEDLLFKRIGCNVTITHCHESRHSEVEGCDVELFIWHVLVALLVDPVHFTVFVDSTDIYPKHT